MEQNRRLEDLSKEELITECQRLQGEVFKGNKINDKLGQKLAKAHRDIAQYEVEVETVNQYFQQQQQQAQLEEVSETKPKKKEGGKNGNAKQK